MQATSATLSETSHPTMPQQDVMFEQAALQRILLFAHMEANRARAAEVRPGHLLLGLRLWSGNGVGRLLQDIPLEQARAALAPVRPSNADLAGQRTIPRSADTERLLRRARDEAAAFGRGLTPGHVLLALFDDDGCARVLAAAGLTETALRARLTERASTPVGFIVGASPDPALLLAPYDRVLHQPFAWILTQEPYTGLAARGAVLTNTSPHQVTAMVTRWTFTDDDGETRSRTGVVDDYFVYNRFRWLGPGRSVLVTPRGSVPPLSAEDRYCVASVDVDHSDAAAVGVTLEIDSAVYADARIAGPDTYDIAAYIHGRHAAAVALMEQVQAAVDAGEDPNTALKRLSMQARQESRTHPKHRWHFRSHNAEWLKQLRHLPPPPPLVRS